LKEERLDELLKIELAIGGVPDYKLDSAVKRQIAGAGGRRVNWLAVCLVCGSLIMTALESALSFMLFGGLITIIFAIIQISILDLIIACCILKKKSERGEPV